MIHVTHIHIFATNAATMKIWFYPETVTVISSVIVTV